MIFSLLRKNPVKIIGERSFALNQARGRLALLSAVFVLAYTVVAIRVVDLSFVQGHLGHQRSVSAQSEAVPAAAIRADIVDRNGTLLATTLKMASLYADPQLIADPADTAQGLVKIFPDLSYGDILQKLQSAKRFVWISRDVTPDEQYAVLELGQPGLGFQQDSKRIYPQGSLISHLIGYTSVDNQGLAGLERSFGRFLNDGKPLMLTVDIRLQHVLRREIQKAITDFDAMGGAGVIVDVTNGEVLAGVSLPDFDPHGAGQAGDQNLFNRFSLGVYELGSVFKIFSTAALLETQNAPMSMTFDAREPIKIGRFTINDYHAQKRVLTVPEVFMHSSNIGSALMGQMVGGENLRDFYRDLGLLESMEIEIGEVGRPMQPEPWGEIATMTASYGHGVATTPLQLAVGVSTIVNGGFLVRPKLVVGPDRSGESEDEVRIVSQKTATAMRKLLRLVVTDGTGANADVPGYSVGGKTGTAEKVGGRGYDTDRLISSFVGVFPMEAPRYAVLVMVDEPKGNKKSFGYATGGWVAAPAVARVISSMGAILGIPAKGRNAEQDISASLKKYVSSDGG